jgi:hypothetical protein
MGLISLQKAVAEELRESEKRQVTAPTQFWKAGWERMNGDGEMLFLLGED